MTLALIFTSSTKVILGVGATGSAGVFSVDYYGEVDTSGLQGVASVGSTNGITAKVDIDPNNTLTGVSASGLASTPTPAFDGSVAINGGSSNGAAGNVTSQVDNLSNPSTTLTGIAALASPGNLIGGPTDVVGGVAASGQISGQAAQGIAVPAYFTPASGYWAQLIVGSPPVHGYAILNSNNGPGLAFDATYLAAVVAAQAAGLKVIGYVWSNYTARSASLLQTDIDNFKLWYNVDGIFIDQCSPYIADIGYYTGLIAYIRATSGTFVVLNPGGIPDEAYISIADSVCIIETDYSTYLTWTSPSWAPNYPANKITHLVYNAPTQANMQNAVTLSRARNAGYVYVTDDVLVNPWDTLASYWTAELATFTSSLISISASTTGAAGQGQIGIPLARIDDTSTLTGISASGFASNPTTRIDDTSTLTGVSASGFASNPTTRIDDASTLTGVSTSGFASNPTTRIDDASTLTGVSTSGFASNPTTRIDDASTLTGVSTSGFASNPTTRIDDASTLTGISASGLASTPTTRIDNIITGVSASGFASAPTLKFDSLVAINGVSSNSAAGIVTAQVNNLSNPSIPVTGVAALASSGNLTIKIDQSITLTGLIAAGTAATLSQSISAYPIGVSGTVIAGTPIVNIDLSRSGTFAAGSAGIPSIRTDNFVSGVPASGLASNPTIRIDDSIIGVSASGVASNPATRIDDSIIGVSAAGLTGTPSIKTDGSVVLTGIVGLGGAGVALIRIDDSSTLTGISAAGNASISSARTDNFVSAVSAAGLTGTPSIKTDGSIVLTGIVGSGGAGIALVQVDDSSILTGISAAGGAGTPSTRTDGMIILVGVSAAGGAGTPSTTADRIGVISGLSASGVVGALTGQVLKQATIVGASATGAAGISLTRADAVSTLTGVSTSGQAGTPQKTLGVAMGVGATASVSSGFLTTIVAISGGSISTGGGGFQPQNATCNLVGTTSLGGVGILSASDRIEGVGTVGLVGQPHGLPISGQRVWKKAGRGATNLPGLSKQRQSAAADEHTQQQFTAAEEMRQVLQTIAHQEKIADEEDEARKAAAEAELTRKAYEQAELAVAARRHTISSDFLSYLHAAQQSIQKPVLNEADMQKQRWLTMARAEDERLLGVEDGFG